MRSLRERLEGPGCGCVYGVLGVENHTYLRIGGSLQRQHHRLGEMLFPVGGGPISSLKSCIREDASTR